MKKRLFKLMKPIAIPLAIGFIYAIFYLITGFGIPCPFKAVTGLYCPGCGISRMFMHMLRFDFPAAFSSNCVVFCALPFFAAGVVRHCCKYIRCGVREISRLENALIIILIVILLIFAVVRNIFPIDILVP